MKDIYTDLNKKKKTFDPEILKDTMNQLNTIMDLLQSRKINDCPESLHYI